MDVISIDLGKYKTGVYAVIKGQASSFRILLKKKIKQDDALALIFQGINDMLSRNNFGIGFIEGYGFAPRNKKDNPFANGLGQEAIILSEIGGVIKLAFKLHGVPLITMPISTWKSVTVGKIDKRKDEKYYLDFVNVKYGKLFDNTDEADAYLIYKAAKEICKRTKYLTPALVRIRESIQAIISKDKETKN